jgi:hypothetical protein
MEFASCRRKVCFTYSTLKMEAVISTEPSVNFCQTRQCYSLKVDNLHSHRAEHLKLGEILNPVFHETRIYPGENRVL